MLRNLMLASVATLLALLAAEGLLRIAGPDGPSMRRFLVWSSPHFTLDVRGATRYLPSENVRTVAVYGWEIVYDVRYRTNNLGLIDHEDYFERSADGRRLVFVGDSFTAGHHGGSPWVPQLRDRVRTVDDIEIYNLGVSGTGIQQFRRLLVGVAEQVPFDEIVILAISDDFLRRDWKPLTQKGEIRFCATSRTKEQCLRRGPVATVIDQDLSEREVLDHVAQVAAKWPPQEADAEWLGSSHLLRLFKSSLLQQRAIEIDAMPKWQRLIFEPNMDALQKIRSTFPDHSITFIHLPEKREVVSGSHYLNLGRYVEQSGLDYHSALEECEWSRGMYFRQDTHPNAEGYANMSSCVARILNLYPAR